LPGIASACGRLRERRGVLECPAALNPLAERQPVALGELLHGQRAQLPTAAELGLERPGVGAAVKRA
jgi:hypothetical protein